MFEGAEGASDAEPDEIGILRSSAAVHGPDHTYPHHELIETAIKEFCSTV